MEARVPLRVDSIDIRSLPQEELRHTLMCVCVCVRARLSLGQFWFSSQVRGGSALVLGLNVHNFVLLRHDDVCVCALCVCARTHTHTHTHSLRLGWKVIDIYIYLFVVLFSDDEGLWK
jgi:hypothetical protein